MTHPNPIVWSSPVAGLRLGLMSGRSVVDLYLENAGTTPLEVMSHVVGRGKHLDWFKLTLRAAGGEVRTVTLADARRESNPVKVSLAPGAQLHHQVDVVSWAARAVNGGKPLSPGDYEVRVVYEVKQSGVWSGRLEAGPATLTVP